MSKTYEDKIKERKERENLKNQAALEKEIKKLCRKGVVRWEDITALHAKYGIKPGT